MTNDKINKIGIGGGCHWCTEAVFQAIKGITEVKQGFISSSGEAVSFSEGVLISFDPSTISLKKIIEIHLATHSSTSDHSLRKKFRSAIYFISSEDELIARKNLDELQKYSSNKIITQILPFRKFKPSREEFRNYYNSNPKKIFCIHYIEPKLKLLEKEFSEQVEKP